MSYTSGGGEKAEEHREIVALRTTGDTIITGLVGFPVFEIAEVNLTRVGSGGSN